MTDKYDFAERIRENQARTHRRYWIRHNKRVTEDWSSEDCRSFIDTGTTTEGKISTDFVGSYPHYL